MRLADITFIIESFYQSFGDMGVAVSDSLVEEMSLLVNEAMSQKSRKFHTPHHIWELVKENTGVIQLAALFHDVVYFSIDGQIPPRVSQVLKDYIEVKKDKVYYSPRQSSDFLHFIEVLFDVKKEQELSQGLNEFLSALTAFQLLKEVLSLHELLELVCCIEATIPFRPIDSSGRNPLERLSSKLKKINRDSQLSITNEQVDQMIYSAQKLSYLDLNGFCSKNTDEFLSDTWLLLAEQNPQLANPRQYLVQDYRKGLQNMANFFEHLNPHQVFYPYKNSPNQKDFELKIKRTEANLDLSTRYLKVKILSVSVLEAFALETGGDLPLVMLTGDIPGSRPRKVKRLEQYLNEPKVHKGVKEDLLNLLSTGRNHSSSFDTTNSPLATYFYKLYGEDRCMQLYKETVKFFSGQLSAKNFLALQENQLLSVLTFALKEMVPTRKKLFAA